jgi:hypothetical protein
MRLNAVRQGLDLVLGLGDAHAAEKSPFLDPPGGRDQLAHGPHHAVGELERVKIARADDDQRAEQQRGVEAQLVDSRALEQHADIVQDLVGALDLLAELGLEHARA